jgi:hypothetical protein
MNVIARPKPQGSVFEEQKQVHRAAQIAPVVEDESIPNERPDDIHEWLLVEKEEENCDKILVRTVSTTEADEKVLFKLRESIIKTYLM